MKLASVVVGVDGSENARLAVEAATSLVAGSNATVHLVYAYDPMPPDMYRDMVAQLPKEFRSSFDSTTVAQRLVDTEVSFAEGHGAVTKGHLVVGHPVSAILDTAEAESADLIVVGSRGTGWATRAFRGSVSSRVANHATRNLLIIHDPD